MVRTRGPLISIDATGTLAKLLIHSSCRGKPYTKRHVVPRDPKSQKQIARRAVVHWLCNAWRSLTAAEKLSWAPLALADNLPPYQAFLRYNLLRFRDQQVVTPLYPPTGGGVYPDWASNSATAQVKQIKLVMRQNPTYQHWSNQVYRDSAPISSVHPDKIVHGEAGAYPESTYYDTNVTPGTNYYYRFVVCNRHGWQRLSSVYGPLTPLP